MGAWIEISLILDIKVGVHVAPHVGAWIEIFLSSYIAADKMSHPTWVRGLKSPEGTVSMCVLWSHPTWVRGLK